MTSKRMLPKEIVSLIHHVQLNESGWWRKSACQIIQGIIFREKDPITSERVIAILREDLGLLVNAEQFDRNIGSLLSSKELVRLGDGRLKLSEVAREGLSGDISRAEGEQTICKEFFIADIAETCQGLDPEEAWRKFSLALAMTVRVQGANAFHMLVDGRLEKEGDWLENLLLEFPEHKDGVNVSIRRFFDPDRVACRAQVLRMISASFFAEASQLSQKSIDTIEAQRKRKTIKVLLDTNFIFSLLSLHDNPANESVSAIIDVVSENSNVVDVVFYVLPSTIVEAEKSISSHLRKIEEIRVTKAIFSASQRMPLSGIAARYFEVASRNDGLTPAEYFRPYIEDMPELLRAKGIRILEEQTDSWRMRQGVVDDLSDELKREAGFPEHRQKGYDQILHDVVLWHVANSRRSSGRTSPLDIDSWVISIDWRLIGFDGRKRGDGSPIPVVLFPTSFLQLLQFWIPRSEKMESVLIDSMRLPLFFQRFDADDESAAIEIIKAVSRYENGEDFPPDVVTRIYANRALRARMVEASGDSVKQAELIREELLAEVAKTKDIIDKKDRELDEARRAEIALVEQVGALGEAHDSAVQQVERELKEQGRLAAEAALIRGRSEREGFLWKYVLFPFVIFLSSLFPSWWYLSIHATGSIPWMQLISFGSVYFLLIGIWLFVAKRRASRSECLATWSLAIFMGKSYRLFFVGFGWLIIQGLIQGGVYDLAKKALGISSGGA